MTSKITVSGSKAVGDNLVLEPSVAEKLSHGSKAEQPLPVIDEAGNVLFMVQLLCEYNLLTGLENWLKTNNVDQNSLIHIEIVRRRRIDPPSIRLTCEQKTIRDDHLMNFGVYTETKGVYAHLEGAKFTVNPTALLTHTFVCGMIGSGKTYCMKVIVEEALKSGIPVVAIDLKGDIASMGVQPPTLRAEELAPFVQNEGESNDIAVARALQTRKSMVIALKCFGISEADAVAFCKSYDFKLLTPGAAYGIPVSLANQLNPPPNAADLRKNDRDLFEEMCTSVTESFFSRLFPTSGRDSFRNERAFLHTLMRYCWENEIDLSGLKGLERLRGFLEAPPFKEVAGQSVEELLRGGRVGRLKDRITTLMSPPEDRWFEGTPLTIDLLISKRDNKTPLTVISVPPSSLFDDRAYIVSQVCFTIVSWMLGTEETTFPRLLLFIDEIGAQGGETSLFPSHPRNPPSKRFLSQIVRQGRSFGVSALLGTQNPTDIDYKALSNCGLWLVSHLKNSRDRYNILTTMYVQDMRRPTVEGWLARDEKGRFVIKSPDKPDIFYVQMRQLQTWHKTLDRSKAMRLQDIWKPGPEFTPPE